MATPIDQEKKKAKAEYDKQYRARNKEVLKAKKAAYYQRTRDPAKEREVRKKRMPRHVEYCRRPEYKQWKAEYDKQYRAKEFGVFGEAYLLLLEVEKELSALASKYERMKAKGYFTRSAQQRRRELWHLIKSSRSLPLAH